MVTPNEPLSGSPIEKVDYDRDFHVGGHASEGIVVVTGDGAASAARLNGTRLVDIVPIILARHGVGVPTDLDGAVLNEAFY